MPATKPTAKKKPARARRLELAPRCEEITLHGHRISYRIAGDSGPVVILVHGITGNSDTWREVQPWLAEGHIVIAPDLMGHGQSAKPRGDYSLGAYASGIRDLMVALGHESATFVGHSLGGGVAMQLAYQFPERLDRLVLVSSGGLGREVHPVLRSTALPLAEFVLPLLVARPLVGRRRRDRRRAAPGRLPGRAGPGRGGHRLRLPERRRGPSGLHPHRARDHRPGRPARRAPPTASTWRPRCPACWCGASATRSSPSPTAAPRTS